MSFIFKVHEPADVITFYMMGSHETKINEPVEELPDAWWHKVYTAVIFTTIVVILLLWAFSNHFSS